MVWMKTKNCEAWMRTRSYGVSPRMTISVDLLKTRPCRDRWLCAAGWYEWTGSLRAAGASTDALARDARPGGRDMETTVVRIPCPASQVLRSDVPP